ncbi:MAG TPA: hypothetical protein VME20_07220 [Acidimicrobiales bacterium]|nr:hypothetical protein [Acidimicrobiales bacterium]
MTTFAARKPLVARRDGRTPATAGFVALTATVAVVALFVWFSRRPDQLLHPYVWADEYHVLNRYQMQGFLPAALAPVKGYFIWPTSWTVTFAAWASFAHLPMVEYWLATAWFLLTLCLLLLPRSVFGVAWQLAAALLLVLAPMNPEIFGVALYSFWWTSLWPFITLVWSKDHWAFRTAAVIIGGMSSPAGTAALAPYLVLWLARRRRRDLVGTVVLFATSVAQTVAYVTSARSQRTPVHPVEVALQELRNFAYYVLAWHKPLHTALLYFLGAAMALFVVAGFGALKAKGQETLAVAVALVVGLVAVGLLSAVPSPLSTDPISAGPRYYFLPFVVLGWVLAMVALASRRRWQRTSVVVLVVLSLVGAGYNYARYEPSVSWQAHLAACQDATGPFHVPVQFTGVVSQMWQDALVVTPATCRRLGYRVK